jgi:hypothetical protein
VPGSLRCPCCGAEATLHRIGHQAVRYECRDCAARFSVDRGFLLTGEVTRPGYQNAALPGREHPDRLYLDAVMDTPEAAAEAAAVLRQAGAETGQDASGRWYTNRKDPRVVSWLAYIADERAAVAESVTRYGY